MGEANNLGAWPAFRGIGHADSAEEPCENRWIWDILPQPQIKSDKSERKEADGLWQRSISDFNTFAQRGAWGFSKPVNKYFEEFEITQNLEIV